MKVLFIDDHVLFARSLELALQESPLIEEFLWAADPDALERELGDHLPDILLVDINLGRGAALDGLTLTGQILSRFPGLPIVILSGYDLPVYRQEARRMGAMGFVSKDAQPETLLRLLEEVHQAGREGRSVFLCPSEEREPELLFYEPLTKAEKDVLLLTAQGIKRKEIARRLQVSERTVSNHLQHIFEKLSVSSSVEAVTKAIRLGYLPPL